jgi:sugar lactone lactonase YvrE
METHLNHPKKPAADAPASTVKKPMIGPVRCLHAAGAELGEGLMWSAREQVLYWVDILGRRLHCLEPISGIHTHWDFAEEISAVAERRERAGLIITLRRGFALFDPATDAEPTYVYQPADEPPGNRFNDGKCDAQGRFWAGTMDFACEAPAGALYRFDPDGQCVRHPLAYAVTNGPTWSLGETGLGMYFNDTANGRVHRFDFDPTTGELSNQRLWLQLAPGDGLPDGMTTDALGRIWLAHWGAACVTCHHPVTAEELARVTLPTSHVTNCTFGGPELHTLFISTARTGLTPEQLTAEPLAGGLFAVPVDCPGLPANLYGG